MPRDIRNSTPASARWGFVPSWAKDEETGRPPPINARAEGVATSGMFKHAYKSKRCLVPINGFFEWKDIYGTGKNKQPYAIAMKSGQPFALAGIWSSRRDPETGLDRKTFPIVTCPLNELMATTHNRMPVILRPEDYERWLSPEPDPHDLTKPFPAELMAMWKIGKDIGSAKNNRPYLIEPIADDLEAPLLWLTTPE
jgi:putative SOS response-associated peptidase YedK